MIKRTLAGDDCCLRRHHDFINYRGALQSVEDALGYIVDRQHGWGLVLATLVKRCVNGSRGKTVNENVPIFDVRVSSEPTNQLALRCLGSGVMASVQPGRAGLVGEPSDGRADHDDMPGRLNP